jgi:hypothetical protein
MHLSHRASTHIFTLVGFLHLAHALPTNTIPPSFSALTSVSSEPDTLLGRSYNILNHDKTLLGITLHVQALAESWENIDALANPASDRDRPLTRATRFQRVHLKRAHREASENLEDDADGLNFLSKQGLPPPAAFVYPSSAPVPYALPPSTSTAAATTPTPAHPVFRPIPVARPDTSTHAATPHHNQKQHKEEHKVDTQRKHRTGVDPEGSYAHL